MQHVENLVLGEWVSGSDAATVEIRDPADSRDVVSVAPTMQAKDIAVVFDAAREGFEHWRTTAALDRSIVLGRAASILVERREEIATDIVREMGKTIQEARVEVTKAADFFNYYASIGRIPYGELLHDQRSRVETKAVREPVGVVLAITPWNDPLLTPARKLAPGLAMGNALILKSASATPTSAMHLARALNDAGLPPGALGTVTGSGNELTDALLLDPRLDAVSFTGSNPVGASLRKTLSATNVRLQTELGGKNAAVVLRDADLDSAALTISAAAFGQAGQRCTATSRVVVEDAVAGEFLDRLVEHAERLQVGPGLDPETTMGPLVSSEQRESVLASVKESVASGGQVLTGGEIAGGEPLSRGWFMKPTILTNVETTMGVWRHELFGPAIAVGTVRDLDEAIRMVNDSRYGLSSGVFTRDMGHAYRFASEVNTGQVAINLPTSGWDVHHPFGGFAASGSAFKEQGSEGMRFYSRVKTIAINWSA